MNALVYMRPRYLDHIRRHPEKSIPNRLRRLFGLEIVIHKQETARTASMSTRPSVTSRFFRRLSFINTSRPLGVEAGATTPSTPKPPLPKPLSKISSADYTSTRDSTAQQSSNDSNDLEYSEETKQEIEDSTGVHPTSEEEMTSEIQEQSRDDSGEEVSEIYRV